MTGIASLTVPVAVAAPAESVTAGVPEQSNVPAVREAQEQYRQTASPEEYAAAMRAFEELQTEGLISRQSEAGPDNSVRGFGCVSIPKWAVVALAWDMIARGAVVGTVGGFLDTTIVGLPAGAVLNALGIAAGTSGNGVLYWADHTDWPKNICL
ncbi:hypothetical protein [Corynebacterium epidermidicanis]|nr:hypothetical protein [Corynebacterium epidermidicanis]